MKKTKPKKRDLPFDELVRQMCRWCERMEKHHGGEVTFRMDFGPKKKPPVLTHT